VSAIVAVVFSQSSASLCSGYNLPSSFVDGHWISPPGLIKNAAGLLQTGPLPLQNAATLKWLGSCRRLHWGSYSTPRPFREDGWKMEVSKGEWKWEGGSLSQLYSKTNTFYANAFTAV